MENKDLQLLLLSADKLQSLLNPVLNKLEVIEKNLNKRTSTPNIAYYRNKDLKENFGLSSNTIIKYRDSGLIPYTTIGDVYLYPVALLAEVLKKNSNWVLFTNKAS
ncbi:helix-turn-helix domain-containing protein [Polaribacter sp. IC063]|uniref:helix-turn-helix domain-containing protein n=1 Tax=Polaribacter sp. IC063 TaxID=57031 RepID=UPI0011BF1ADF|nr:helix-turn-helix domain-containing protein [Polaribacter sp. IC063]TXD53654.1 helix-turn-helix domain-containing protein [Polaribacter sp. IC063]